MEYFAKQYDVAVIGAGHAGIEAALAAARLGCCWQYAVQSVHRRHVQRPFGARN